MRRPSGTDEIYASMFFLRMGTTGLTARDRGEGWAWLARSILVSLVIGATLIGAQGIILWAALANAVLFNFQMFMAYGLDGFANAAEAFAGETIGARDRNGFRAAVRATSVWALILSVACAAAYAVLGGFLIDCLTHVDEVRAAARAYLPWAAARPLISAWSFQLDGIFIGATRTAEMRNSMALSLAIFVLCLAVLVPALGNHGLWLGFSLFMAARAVTLGSYYPRIERDL